MTVITISRQYGSRGDYVADQVCQLLGYRRFDKRLITQAAVEAGISEQEVVDYSEENHQVRSFFDRLFGRARTVAEVHQWREDAYGVLIAERLVLSDAAVLTLVQKAVLSAYQAGNIVIVGRGGQAILKDHADVLHVRIVAPIEQRIQDVKAQLKDQQQVYLADIENRRAAQDLIIERDLASADYIKQYYNMNWDDPLYYHLVINTGKMAVEEAAWLISQTVKQIGGR